MSKQPEALRLIEALAWNEDSTVQYACDELRRLHALNAELVDALHRSLNVLDATGATYEANFARAALKKATEAA
jgi:hypothetical protein